MSLLFPDKGWAPDSPEDSVSLWRYIDFTQFVSILEHERLWFASAGTFLDPWEGALRESEILEVVDNLPPFIDGGETTVKNLFDSLRTSTYVSCWHEALNESASMWQLYNERGKEVAITTTAGKLRQAIDDEEDLTLGRVNYLDYDDDDLEIPISRLSPFFHKRDVFSHEHECRLVKSELSVPRPTAVDSEFKSRVSESTPTGQGIEVDPEELIERVIVSPVVGGWMDDLVEEVLKTHNLHENVEVERSDLTQDPFENMDVGE